MPAYKGQIYKYKYTERGLFKMGQGKWITIFQRDWYFEVQSLNI